MQSENPELTEGKCGEKQQYKDMVNHKIRMTALQFLPFFVCTTKVISFISLSLCDHPVCEGVLSYVTVNVLRGKGMCCSKLTQRR